MPRVRHMHTQEVGRNTEKTVRVGEGWKKLWPCGVFKSGDKLQALFAPNGDLIDYIVWRDGNIILPESTSDEFNALLNGHIEEED